MILMVFRKATLLVLIPIFYSCATQKELGNKAKEVVLYLNNAVPYCGGAAPSPEMVIPILEPIQNISFLLYAENVDGSRGRELKTIATDNEGKFLLYLPLGKYQLWRPSKKLNLDQFVKAESPEIGPFYSYNDKECFQAWRERADFIFDIRSDTTISLSRPINCYTFDNPCMLYIGPLRP